MDAFSKLSTCRAIGMALGPIPWSAASDYALRFGLDEDEFEILWELISRLDSAYLGWQAKQKPIKDKEPVASKDKQPRIIHTGKK